MREILADQNNASYAWYLVRAGGLTAFLLLYITIFIGVASGLPGLRRIFLPLFNLPVHGWISLQALIFVLFHTLGTFFDRYTNFSLADVLIPGLTSYHPLWIAMGILGFYLMVALIVTSYVRARLPQKLWRFVHYGNLLLYVFVLIHTVYLGTDIKSGWLRTVFIWANALLIMLLVLNMIIRIRRKTKKKPESSVPAQIIPPPLQ